MDSYNKTKQFGYFHDVCITIDLVAKALEMKVEKWQSLSTHVLNKKGILANLHGQYFQYNEVLEIDLVTQLQMLDLKAMFIVLDHINCGTTTALICMVEKKLAFNYIHGQLMEGLHNTKFVLANPQ